MTIFLHGGTNMKFKYRNCGIITWVRLYCELRGKERMLTMFAVKTNLWENLVVNLSGTPVVIEQLPPKEDRKAEDINNFKLKN